MALFSRKKSPPRSTATSTRRRLHAPAAAPVAVLDRDAFDAATQAVGDVTGTYDLDPTHTRIGFSARHAMVTTVRGVVHRLHRRGPHRHRRPARPPA